MLGLFFFLVFALSAIGMICALFFNPQKRLASGDDQVPHLESDGLVRFGTLRFNVDDESESLMFAGALKYYLTTLEANSKNSLDLNINPDVNAKKVAQALYSFSLAGIGTPRLNNAKTKKSAIFQFPGGGDLHGYSLLVPYPEIDPDRYRDTLWIDPKTKSIFAWMRIDANEARALGNTISLSSLFANEKTYKNYYWILSLDENVSAEVMIDYMNALYAIGSRDVFVVFKKDSQ